jgi:hypothetical protein
MDAAGIMKDGRPKTSKNLAAQRKPNSTVDGG